jgi:stage VI sporulation protein D
LTQDNLSCLRFSIEESIWFQKGQEVSELLSISLDPNISIQENEQYVSIRGALLLTGEYEMVQSDDEEQSLREYTSGKQVHEVLFREEDGVSQFQHQFPLDITIPKNRIENMDDVYVSIDMFDYDFPTQSSLSLTADLSITGLYGEQQSVARLEEEEEDEAEFLQDDEQGNPVFQQTDESEEIEFEPLYRSGNQEEEEQPEEQPAALERFSSEQQDEQDIYRLFPGDAAPASHAGDVEVSDEDELYEPFEVEVKRDQPEEEASVPSFELRAKNIIPLWKDEQVETERRDEAHEQYGKASHAQETGGEETEKTVRKENALYLTQLFSKNEEEDFSRLKMCIVQNGDSLEQIAERYDTNVQNLLRVNNIDDNHDLSEGTILNIPVGSKR